jgi:hypothetical protein
MKRHDIVFFISLALVLFFSGCPTDPDPEESEKKELLTLDGPFTVYAGETRYFSLTDGKEVSDPKTKDWDIAFEYNRLIYTNSGDTAADLESGGLGGVWCTGQTNFDAVNSADGAGFSAAFATDTKRYTNPAAEMGAPTLNRINVITYIGYGSGDGETADTALTDYLYNAQQFYTADLTTMPPTYSLTKWVYIIKHGNGTDYSKVQISYMQSFTSTAGNRRIYEVAYKKL